MKSNKSDSTLDFKNRFTVESLASITTRAGGAKKRQNSEINNKMIEENLNKKLYWPILAHF